MNATLPSTAERQFITRLGGTSLYLSMSREPWRLPAQALVLPMGPRAGMNGILARAFRAALGPEEETIRKLVQSEIASATKAERLTPERPVLVPIPSSLPWPGTEDTSDPASAAIGTHFIIAATAYGAEQVSASAAAVAVRALLVSAAEAGVRSLILPTLGTGQGNQPSEEVIIVMAEAIQSSLLSTLPGDRGLEEITLVTLDPKGKDAAFDFFTTRGQRLLNDLPEGGDLLNVAVEARTLAETLLRRDLKPPLSVAIMGGWGSGKSFIMHLMQERMTELRAVTLRREQAWPGMPGTLDSAQPFPYVGHIYQIKFDAWTYAKGDLWSSLMQAIFTELNRQISLEKRLREAYAAERSIPAAGEEFLLEGGAGWRALNEMSDEARDAILQHSFREIYDKWKVSSTGAIDDVLWEELKKLQQQQRQKLEATLEAKKKAILKEESSLQEKQIRLSEASAKLHELKHTDPVRQAQEEATRELPVRTLKILGANALRSFEQQLKAATAADGSIASIDGSTIRPGTIRIFWEEVRQDPKSLRWFLVLVGLGTASFLLALLANRLIPQLVASVVALTGYALAVWKQLGPWLKKTSQQLQGWDQSVQDAYKAYQDLVAKHYQLLKEQTEQEIERHRQLEKQVADAQDQLAALEAELEHHRESMGPIASYNSLLEFMNSRLNKTYESRLGLIQDVQRDLRELSHTLVADGDRPERIPERLRELFPRGPARIVLFIDDLDRCPPGQVVQVLEAAQLLLKTELFVVILAVDVRYVARALEKIYNKILVRHGKPSGLDYVEKIIQIPYRVRSIDAEALATYLRAQMQVSAPRAREQPGGLPRVGSLTDRASGQAAIADSARIFQVPPPRILEFTEAEMQRLLKTCRVVDLSPRAIKRLVNVVKIIKVVWFRTCVEATEDAMAGVFGLLALSDRFPDLMRELLDELATYLRLPGNETDIPFCELISRFRPTTRTEHQRNEWATLQRTVSTTDLLPGSLTPGKLGMPSFNLVRSFCFVGDIGYDPEDDKET